MFYYLLKSRLIKSTRKPETLPCWTFYFLLGTTHENNQKAWNPYRDVHRNGRGAFSGASSQRRCRSGRYPRLAGAKHRSRGYGDGGGDGRGTSQCASSPPLVTETSIMHGLHRWNAARQAGKPTPSYGPVGFSSKARAWPTVRTSPANPDIASRKYLDTTVEDAPNSKISTAFVKQYSSCVRFNKNNNNDKWI